MDNAKEMNGKEEYINILISFSLVIGTAYLVIKWIF